MQKQSMSSILQQKALVICFWIFCRYCLKRNLTLWMFCVRCSKECIIRSPASMDTTHLHAKQEAVIMRFFIF